MSITGFIANEDFWSPPPLPPYRIDFAKNRKKSEFFSGGGSLRGKNFFFEIFNFLDVSDDSEQLSKNF